MTEKILQHSHCPVCGKAMPADEKTCSETCKLRMDEMIKKRKLLRYAYYAVMILFILILVMGPLFG